MKKTFALVLLLTFVFATSLMGQIYDPVKWKVTQKTTGENTAEIYIKASINEGWHIYGMDIPKDGPKATSIVFDKISNAKVVGNIICKSELKTTHDANFDMDLSWYGKEAIFVQKITFTDPKLVKISGHIEYMACNDVSCLPPKQEIFRIGKIDSIAAAKTILPVAKIENNKTRLDYWKPVIEELNSFASSRNKNNSSLLLIFLVGFLGGFLALLTPCVWPIIPMTVSFFIKRSRRKTEAARDAIFYGLSIIVIYVSLGILITLFFGASALNSLSTSAFFNLLFFGLLVVFAISFFGAFEITLPSSWSSKIDAKADKSVGFVSILFMAFTLALVSFSCTGPIIGTLLVEVSNKGSIFSPIVGMLGFSVALAIPFSLFAFFPTWLKSLPRSGGWLNSVKVVLAFLELALALKFLSVADLAYGWHILDREVFLSIWIIIFILLGFYLVGSLRFKHDTPSNHSSVIGVILAIISFSFSLYLLPGLWGAPLKSISAFTPPLITQDFNLEKNEVKAVFTDYDKGMEYASSNKLPAIIDFTGYGCVNCRKMEASVWTDARVKDVLTKKFVLISLYVDDKTPLKNPYQITENANLIDIKTVGDKWSYLQRKKFGANAQPFYVMLDNKGKPMRRAYSFDENPSNFLEWLTRN